MRKVVQGTGQSQPPVVVARTLSSAASRLVSTLFPALDREYVCGRGCLRLKVCRAETKVSDNHKAAEQGLNSARLRAMHVLTEKYYKS